MMKRFLLICFLSFTVAYMALPTTAYAISLDDDEEDREDAEDEKYLNHYLKLAKNMMKMFKNKLKMMEKRKLMQNLI